MWAVGLLNLVVNFRCLKLDLFFEKTQVCIQRSKKKKMDCGTSGGGDLKDFYKGFSLEWYNIAFNVEGNLPESTGKLGNQVPVA